MITYKKLAEKFIDKGYIQELHWRVLPPPIFDNSRLIGAREENIKSFLEAVDMVYGEDWEYWSQWIDHQNYK